MRGKTAMRQNEKAMRNLPICLNQETIHVTSRSNLTFRPFMSCILPHYNDKTPQSKKVMDRHTPYLCTSLRLCDVTYSSLTRVFEAYMRRFLCCT